MHTGVKMKFLTCIFKDVFCAITVMLFFYNFLGMITDSLQVGGIYGQSINCRYESCDKPKETEF